MKKTITFLFAILCTAGLFAQSNVYLKINHKLGVAPFAMNTAASNNMGNDFNVTRLQYYISDIVVIHDGGVEDAVTNKWILVNSANPVNELLGSFNVTNLEGVKFGIGVGPDVNNDDPSLWPSNHPLAPKSPSMHWGWTSGYRFVAMEGNSGTNLAQSYQIHALGNNNYFIKTIMTSGTTNGMDLVLDIDADYTMALKNIDVSAGPISHGDNGEARSLLLNFNSDVFSPATAVSISEPVLSANFNLFPNPTNGLCQVSFDGNASADLQLVVNDLAGKQIAAYPMRASGNFSFSMPSGFYMVSLQDGQQKLAVKRLLVTQ